jgi:hypothetical protein
MVPTGGREHRPPFRQKEQEVVESTGEAVSGSKEFAGVECDSR